MTVTQPLRDEHKELAPHIETLRTVGDSVGQAPIESLRRGVEDVFEFLRHHLIPHAEAEERALWGAALSRRRRVRSRRGPA